MYSQEESLVLVSAQSSKLEEKLGNNNQIYLIYSKEESLELINAQSTKLEDRAIETEAVQREHEYALCPEENRALVFAESSKLEEPNKENMESIFSKSTWRFEEVFAIMENCYDPRSFGRVSLKRAVA